MLDSGVNSVTFLNENLSGDTSKPKAGDNFLIAEYGFVPADTVQYFWKYRLSTTDTGEWRKPWYYSPTPGGKPALSVLSSELIRLKKPFPFRVTAIETKKNIIGLERSVIVLNRRLNKRVERANLQIQKRRFKKYFHPK